MGLVKPVIEAPARVDRRRSPWDAVLAAVAAARGKWCRVAEYPASLTARTTVSDARKRHHGFEFTARTIDGKGVVYARLKAEGDK